MPKGKPQTQYDGTWELKAPSGKPYKGHLQWKRFYASGDCAERYILLKIVPIKKKRDR
jgi:hypothetical protein